MRIWFGLAIVPMLVACQQQETPVVQKKPRSEMITQSALQNVRFTEVAELPYTKPDKRLSYGPSALQFVELWLPKADPRSAPQVIFVHGGCWLNQYDLKHTYPAATALQKRGYAVWSVEYRRTGDPGGGWPGSLNDIVEAIEFIQTQNQYLGNSQSVNLVGHSAGGHLALLANGQLITPVDRLIGLAPIVDIEAYAKGSNSCQAATSDFMGGTPEQLPHQYREANPINFSYDTQVTILGGEKDTLVPLTTPPLPTGKFSVIEGAGHFDWVHPDSVAFSYFVDSLKSN